jgi:hypothetical protein
MPLLELQTALATLVTWRASTDQSATTVLPSLAGLNLTVDEQAWLAQLSGTPGFDATCYIQRWWRETKLRWTTRLTLAALGAEQGTALLKAYLNITPCASLFFTPEAVGFLDFVAHETITLPHVAEIAQFERAMIVVRDAAHQFNAQKVAAYELEPDQQLAPHPAAALLAFAAPPEELLGALVQSQPLPPARRERFPILIAPGLPHLWRPAAPIEVQLFNACQPVATVASLRALSSLTTSAPCRRVAISGSAGILACVLSSVSYFLDTRPPATRQARTPALPGC